MSAATSQATLRAGAWRWSGWARGGRAWRTPEVAARAGRGHATSSATQPYLDLVGALGPHQAPPPLRQPRGGRPRPLRPRPGRATGRDVVVVSSGDPGVFAMAAAVVEELDGRQRHGRWADVDVVVLPGVTAAHAAAARVGAPLGHDFCARLAVRRAQALGGRRAPSRGGRGGRSRPRPLQPDLPPSPLAAGPSAGDHRRSSRPDTPVVVARDVSRPDERIEVVALSEVSPIAST